MKQEYKIRVSGNSLALTIPDELGWGRGDRVRIIPVTEYAALVINIDRLREDVTQVTCRTMGEDKS